MSGVKVGGGAKVWGGVKVWVSRSGDQGRGAKVIRRSG